ncbi:MAG TPA: beta-propeller fold lactonase family protein, partial [Gaiellaceae bacterium]|nr:beta-propeller fold lactonase family protein [Gaiellaceae bacterium]
MDRIYVQTNDAERNEIVVFDRAADGSLSALGRFETGGRGSGTPHLASQSSVVVSGDRLLVTNAGSDELSLFAVQPDGLRLEARIASGGSHPTSVAVAGDLAYVLNNGTPSIFGFSLAGGSLEPIAGSDRPLAADADPAQIAFGPDGRTLVVTERGTNSISTFAVGDDG